MNLGIKVEKKTQAFREFHFPFNFSQYLDYLCRNLNDCSVNALCEDIKEGYVCTCKTGINRYTIRNISVNNGSLCKGVIFRAS